MSQGKLNGSNNTGMSPSGSSPIQGIGSANNPFNPNALPQAITSSQFGKPQGQSQQTTPKIGQMGTTFGSAPGGDGGVYGPVQPQQPNPALTNGAGPLDQSIGPVAPKPDNQDSLGGLPGPDDQQYATYNGTGAMPGATPYGGSNMYQPQSDGPPGGAYGAEDVLRTSGPLDYAYGGSQYQEKTLDPNSWLKGILL